MRSWSLATRRTAREPGCQVPSRPAYHSSMHPGADNPAAGSPRYLDRELSWLEFNARVLALAENTAFAVARAREVLADLQLQPRPSEFFQECVSGLQGTARSRHPPHGGGGHRPGRAVTCDSPSVPRRLGAAKPHRCSPKTSCPRWNARPASGVLRPRGRSRRNPAHRQQLTSEFDDRIFPIAHAARRSIRAPLPRPSRASR